MPTARRAILWVRMLLLAAFAAFAAPSFAVDRIHPADVLPRERAPFSDGAGFLDALHANPAAPRLNSLAAAELTLDAEQSLREAPGDYELQIDGIGKSVRLVERASGGSPARTLTLPMPRRRRAEFPNLEREIDVRGLAQTLERSHSPEAVRDFLDRLYEERSAPAEQALALRIDRTLELGRFDAAVPLLHRYRELPEWTHEQHLRPVLERRLPDVRQRYVAAHGRVPLKIQVRMSRERELLRVLLDNVMGEQRASVFHGWPDPDAAESRPAKSVDSGFARHHVRSVRAYFRDHMNDEQRNETLPRIIRAWAEWLVLVAIGLAPALSIEWVIHTIGLPEWTHIAVLAALLPAAMLVRLANDRVRIAKTLIAMHHGWRPEDGAMPKPATPAEEPAPHTKVAAATTLEALRAELPFMREEHYGRVWRMLGDAEPAVRAGAAALLAEGNTYFIASYVAQHDGERWLIGTLRTLQPAAADRLSAQLAEH